MEPAFPLSGIPGSSFKACTCLDVVRRSKRIMKSRKFGGGSRHMLLTDEMPADPSFVTASGKKFSEHVELRPETAVFPRKAPILGSLGERCRSFQHFSPTGRMLSPIWDPGLQTGNGTPNFGICCPNATSCRQSHDCCPKS